ncbi:hypothetical protein H0264_32750 [Nocardia huaxiensis]|uniref:Uncharacterized protein n=1 Tax=Nocardia huaxiensis TaxID=2755382 RepID=A0A7D6Z157_9NOCA|nr:hypothetical protein [Nocardia huaxiensis]QLY29926.1 hypothetical protein H0264_32750 [Nocardia huaxiensis]
MAEYIVGSNEDLEIALAIVDPGDTVEEAGDTPTDELTAKDPKTTK